MGDVRRYWVAKDGLFTDLFIQGDRLIEVVKRDDYDALRRVTEQAEARLAAVVAALEFYGRHEHWTALTALGNKDRNVVLVAHSSLGDATQNGWTVAETVLAEAKEA